MTGLHTGEGLVPTVRQYLLPSPSGVLRAVSGDRSPQRELLRALLRVDTTLELSEPALRRSVPEVSSYRVVELITELRRLGLLDLVPRPYHLGDQKIEDVAPRLLERLSAEGRGLLADNEGFLVSSIGLPDHQAVRLAALASELVAYDVRWRAALETPPSGQPTAWWATAGRSRYGLVVLRVGPYPFVLALEGEIQLLDPACVWLVWALSYRYDRGTLEL